MIKRILWLITIRNNIASELIKSETKIASFTSELIKYHYITYDEQKYWNLKIEEQRKISDLLRKLL